MSLSRPSSSVHLSIERQGRHLLRRCAPLALVALASAATPLHAERPMNVDDASTLDRGGAKLEFGACRDARGRGVDAAAGYGVLDGLEVEVNGGRASEGATEPLDHWRGVGLAAKWVPLRAGTGLSAGVKYEHTRLRYDDAGDARIDALLALATWRFDGGAAIHLNLGREWSRAGGDREHADVWGIGTALPVAAALELTLETFGARGAKPDSAIGLRYAIVEGVKLSAAIGHGNDRVIANAGVAWEF